jgi:hypothetical protein
MKYPSDISNWTTQMAHDAFGLSAKPSLTSLTEWLTSPIEALNESDKQYLDKTLVKQNNGLLFGARGILN